MVARMLVLLLVAVVPASADTFTCPEPVKQPARQALVEPWPLLEQVAPMTSWSCLDGETVGILHDVSGSIAPIGWNDDVYALQPQHTGRYLFTSNQNTPMLPYFRAPAGAKDTNGFTTPDGANKWINYDHVWNLAPGKHAGLTREAHLVRVRVNEGKGYGGGSLHFFGDQIQVLDGTKAYPLHVADVIRKVLAPIESDLAWRTKLRGMVDAQATRDKTLAALKRGADRIEGGYRVTWLTDKNVLAITFYARDVREYSGTTKNPDPQAGMVTCHAPPGADCAPHKIPTTFTRTRTLGAELAVETTFDRTGTLLDRHEQYADAPARDNHGVGGE